MSEEFRDRLRFILESIHLVESRFRSIEAADDFISNEEGQILLDSISMRLQAIGENIKSINKHQPDLLLRYNSIDWTNIMRMRDIISHHYEGLDYEIIYDVCKEKIPDLKVAIVSLLQILE
ncbi:DUF86 domain-containing protein [Leptospira langatensis]|uniref:DUF86 domain-containing protein n=1 Tax=Leptospira langatensis TaxID=2484983 RepID=A0A5F1ZTI5_9LEPT|nr:HepT-like ribonuclease domain-containing protein [Leptospira langatensis]TGK03007.1 DUF86 domain-containing protein [Leptospira langatensis]TGL41763.1 DUF86 domain-containing protein [Leptospira langatensis]